MDHSYRKLILTALFFSAVYLLGGCTAKEEEEEPWVPAQTAIQADPDGTLTETLIEKLDQDYYDPAELKSMAEEAVREYTSENGADSVRLESFEAEGNSVCMVMIYRGWQDYSGFNNVRFYNGTMLGAQMEGWRMEKNFHPVNPEDGSSAGTVVSFEEPLSHKEYYVMVSDPDHIVEVPGEIRYISENASVTDFQYAYPDKTEEKEEQDTVTGDNPAADESGRVIIIYEPFTELNTKDGWKQLLPFGDK